MRKTEIEKVLSEHPDAAFSCGKYGDTLTGVRLEAKSVYRRKPTLHLVGKAINKYADPPEVCAWETWYVLGQVNEHYADTTAEAIAKLIGRKEQAAVRQAELAQAGKHASLLADRLRDLFCGVGMKGADPRRSVYGDGVTITMSNADAEVLVEKLKGYEAGYAARQAEVKKQVDEALGGPR